MQDQTKWLGFLGWWTRTQQKYVRPTFFFDSGDSWMYPYQRTPMGNPYISPISTMGPTLLGGTPFLVPWLIDSLTSTSSKSIGGHCYTRNLDDWKKKNDGLKGKCISSFKFWASFWKFHVGKISGSKIHVFWTFFWGGEGWKKHITFFGGLKNDGWPVFHLKMFGDS